MGILDEKISRRKALSTAGKAAIGLGAALAASNLAPTAAWASTQQGQASIAASSSEKESNGVNVVLVHGIWADGSSYSGVIPLLLREGYKVWAPQLPLTTHLADDVNATLGVISQLKGPTVLVGHSYGGAVITNAGAGLPNVVGLVYCSAFAPDLGEVLGQFPPGPGLANLYPGVYPTTLG